ncbi:MAG: hypothetical protein O7E52_26940 [Candidatus Poribacteria bacterium]|nr:hypothetical protein [Candidatus Poribacteria bacterium]
MSIVVHVTHEAIQKMGGIGAVLEGLLTARSYNENIERTFLVGSLFHTGELGQERLGKGGEVLYSSLDGIRNTPYADALQAIEIDYQIAVVYGRRRFENRSTGLATFAEVILIEVSHMNPERENLFKWRLYEHFDIDSRRYEHDWGYEEYLRIAEPAYDALRVLIADQSDTPCFVIAHEFMGMPFALKTILEGQPNMRTIFYAHEVATVRSIVEYHSGHDTMFYNVMHRAMGEGKSIGDVFGDQFWYSKHALIDKAHLCDNIFAVGDLVVEELRFLSHVHREHPIDLVYNGIPAIELDLAAKLESKKRLQKYAETLLGYIPDYVLTHVTRLVHSKGLWRDLQLLYHLDVLLKPNDKTAVLFILSTEIATGRSSEDVHRMEEAYGWPVHHEIGYPDLVGAEVHLNNGVVAFNRQSQAIKAVFVNQFGWSRERCGMRMPDYMEFMDIRKGSDVEFGQSIYEPFGIAQVEPLSFGAICAVSNVCGCTGFIRRATGGADVPNVIVADYTHLAHPPDSIEGLLAIGTDARNQIEAENSWDIAAKLLGRLPRNIGDVEEIIARGYEIASKMSWEVVVSDYFLPGLQRALENS